MLQVDRVRLAAGVVAAVGLLWAVFQAANTYAVVEAREVAWLGCPSVDRRPTLYVVLTAGAAAAAVGALGLAALRRPRAAFVAVAVEVAFAVAWLVAGAWRAAGCALSL